MGNTASLNHYLLATTTSDSDNNSQCTMTQGNGQIMQQPQQLGEDRSLSLEEEDDEPGGRQDAGQTIGSVEQQEEEALATQSHEHEAGGRLWKVTPVDHDNEQLLSSSLQVHRGGEGGGGGANTTTNNNHDKDKDVGIAAALDENDHEAPPQFFPHGPLVTARDLGNVNGNTKEDNDKEFIDGADRVFVDNRLPTLMDDMPTIYENHSSGDEKTRKARNRHSDGDDSSTLNPKDRNNNDNSSSSSSSTWICTIDPRALWCIFLGCFILFVLLLGAFLFVALRDDDDDESRGIEIEQPPIWQTLAPTPSLSGLAVPTISPSIQEIFQTPPTSFPTFSARLWAPAGSAIMLQDGGYTAPALAFSFDGQVLAVMGGSTVQAYEWGPSQALWQPRGPAVETTVRTTRRVPGMALSLDGNVLAWGDPTTRLVHVLEWNADTWQERSVIAIDNDADVDSPTGEFYSLALSASGNVIAVGDADALEFAGKAHVLQWDAGNQQWNRISTWTGSAGSRTGFALALSWDGKTVAVGAVENALATIVPGMVRVYRQEQGGKNSWGQIGQTIVGFRHQDRFGATVSLSGGGNILAVGAPLFDSKKGDKIVKQNPGQVRVFEWNAQVGLWGPLGQDLPGTVSDQGMGQVLSLSIGGDMVAAAGSMGGLQIHKLNENKRWITWPLSGTNAPSDVASAVLAGSGRVVALADRTTGAVFVYQAVNW